MKKWGAHVLANGVLAPDVPPIPSLPPQSRRNLERDEPAYGERERMCVCGCGGKEPCSSDILHVCVFLEWPQLTCDFTDSN